MSEAERKRRQNYKRNRKRWIVVQTVAFIIVALIALSSFLVYNKLDSTYYIEYTEDSSANYKVQYKDNTFFEEEWLDAGQSYVSSLVNGIKADFNYQMNMDASSVAFDYSYEIVAQLIISDKKTGAHIYDPIDVLIPETKESVKNDDELSVDQSVFVDFVKYNSLAYQFINVYGLHNATSSLVVSLKVNVLSVCDEFEMNNQNAHTVSILVPLGEENFIIENSNSAPTDEKKVLACKSSAEQKALLTTSIVAASIALLIAIFLHIFMALTKNKDITYANKVRKILSSYRSFIQQIHGEFDSNGYQLVPVRTIKELLGIRDTIQSPILMSENVDETRAQFLIPTNTKILYMFEIKVENYDELYGGDGEKPDPDLNDDNDGNDGDNGGNTPDAITPVVINEYLNKQTPFATTDNNAGDEAENEAKEPENEASVIDEAAIEIAEQEEITSAPVDEIDTNSLDEASIDDDNLDDDSDSDGSLTYFDENENKLVIRCSRSCMANIIQSENEGAKSYYSELKNYILSYEGVKARMSWRYEAFNRGRQQLVRLKIRGKAVCVFLALDPNEFDPNKYFHKAIESKNFQKVPMLVRVKSDGALKKTKKLIDLVMEKAAIEPKEDFVGADYVAIHPYERTQALIDRGLIKILVPDGYIVADPTHIVKAESLKQFEEAKNALAADEAVKLAPVIENKTEASKEEEISFVPDPEIANIIEMAMDTIATEETSFEETQEIQKEIIDAIQSPDVELSEIDFVDEVDEVYESTEEKPGVEVIAVVWPEHKKKNKVYRYDPNGEKLNENDTVLVPTRDVHKNREVVRKATVAHSNHTVDPDTIKNPLKKIIAVIKHNVENMLSAGSNDDKKRGKKKK